MWQQTTKLSSKKSEQSQKKLHLVKFHNSSSSLLLGANWLSFIHIFTLTYILAQILSCLMLESNIRGAAGYTKMSKY